ncbi:SprT-like domain-containing protein [Nitrospina gracilis]|uniref:SprT-like domain-containing protein n=1 Tax=Nitrospina gracilis TaxID=35801 RepID=UPI001F2E3203|nr:SprT-like domain-containing protein [Nitrospina gracilis]MCF8720030.1 hypothetical protein [Nitrospina gracilis Nb-211]
MTATATTPSQSTTIKPGTVVLGEGRFSGGDAYRALFRIRKGGFEYLGQVNVHLGEEGVRLEMFNANYFGLFEAEAEVVTATLERTLLNQLLGRDALNDRFRDVIHSRLEESILQPLEPLPAIKEEADPRDLQGIFDRLNAEYFEGKVEAGIEWSKETRIANRRSVKFGSYDARKKLIRIHPRLKQDFVPIPVLELTVFHEMCHQAVPPVRQNGQWKTHHREFKAREKEYKHYKEAMQWEKKHWAKLLAPSPSE